MSLILTKYLQKLAGLGRPKKVAIQMIADGVAIVFSFLLAMALRLDSLAFATDIRTWMPLILVVPITLATYALTGVYLTLVRFVSRQILRQVAVGALVSALALYFSSLVLPTGIPRSVPAIHALVLFLTIGGMRFLAQNLFGRSNRSARRPVLIYGAGEAGLQLLHSLAHGSEFEPVAFLDDNPNLQGFSIGGLGVVSLNRAADLVRETEAKEVLLAIPTLSRVRRREIILSLEGLGLEIKTIPSLSDIVNGRAEISELRTVSPEDLLGRDPIHADADLLQRNVAGHVVMVSGAGGSIGSELCRQILSQNPKKLILYEVSEFALYTIESELSETASRTNSPVDIVAVLGSVQHPKRLAETIRDHRVQTIYHAAAYKHVPLVEDNIVEGIQNNVFGTLSIALAAKTAGVRNFILVSTDKAVRPTNVMGASKRIAELICQALAQSGSDTDFSMVRFGNVLGSSGSVIPRFREQIKRGGPVTVTHNEVNRYFMTIPEAAQLVIQAGAMARGGDVFVLDMGDPVNIMDLAKTMVKLHGLVPYVVDSPSDPGPQNGDIPICVTGLRKGEKLYEELLIGNDPMPTSHPRIMTATEVSLPYADLEVFLERLKAACSAFDAPAILQTLLDMPLGYRPTATSKPDPAATPEENLPADDVPLPRIRLVS